MSVRVMSWVWDYSPVGGNDRLMLLAIADNADDTGANAWPSIATLARKTRVDERTVQRIIRRLTDGGHLKVEATAGGRRSNRYTVVMTPPPSAEEPANGSYPQDDGNNPQPPAERHPGNLPPRHGATPAAAQLPPLPRRNYAARTSLTHPRTTHRRAAGARTPTTPPGRCPYHLGQPAHNCAPCRSEMPDLQKALGEVNDASVVVLGVNKAQELKEIAPFADESHISFPLIANPAGDIAGRYAAQNLPTSYFINSDGTIGLEKTGVMNYSFIKTHLDLLK
jgi:thiol-disulfide isomerase/thioredoxin